MSFPRYGRYQDSGVSWLGLVPEHWTLSKLKHFTTFSGGGTPSRDNPLYWNGDVPWVSPKDMKVEVIQGSEEYVTASGLKNSSSSLVTAGHVLMVVRSGILQHTIPIAINAVPVSLNQDMKALRFTRSRCLNRFFMRWVQGLNALLLLIWAKQGATVESIEHAYLANTVIALPPLEEQSSIAAFLDRETSKTDALIGEQQRLIELLMEKRQAMISSAVTKGLNPSVRMKDSGIDWLGGIPEHWSLKRLGVVADLIQTGPFGSQLHSEDYVEGQTPVINPSNIQDGVIVANWSCTVGQGVVERLSHHKLQEGDIVFARRGEMGRCATVSGQEAGWLCGTGSLTVRMNRTMNSEFVSFFLRTGYVRNRLEIDSVGSTMDNLNTSIVSRIPIPVPPVEEQKSICAFLRFESAKLDDLMNEVLSAKSLLQERRTALISAAVTGKIDVRGLVTAEPETEAAA